jgi:hypothetical protein
VGRAGGIPRGKDNAQAQSAQMVALRSKSGYLRKEINRKNGGINLPLQKKESKNGLRVVDEAVVNGVES